jgi:Sugar transferases involved in lipopolysaccharide synthesis
MYKLSKRTLDLLISTVGLILLSPIFILCIIILLCTGEHEVFYLQQRIGYQGKPFYIFKFSTMMKNSSSLGTGYITVRNDPRVYPFGKFLRRTKINELPQILNVFFGSMSIIGPRPLLPSGFYQYSEEVQKKISALKPGITGIGSVIFRDEEKYTLDTVELETFYKEFIIPYKGALEVWFSERTSLMLDIKLIILTAWVVCSSESNLPYKWFKDLPPKPEWMD